MTIDTSQPRATVTVRLDGGTPLRRIWRYVGYDEPNYTYTPSGRALLGKLGGMSDAPYYIRCLCYPTKNLVKAKFVKSEKGSRVTFKDRATIKECDGGKHEDNKANSNKSNKRTSQPGVVRT